MRFSTYAGIDPGANGGIAAMIKKRVEVVKNFDSINSYMSYWEALPDPKFVVVEKVGLWSSDMTVPGKAFGIQKLKSNYDMIINSLEATKTPYCIVHPATWQKVFIKGKSKGRKKKEWFKRFAATIYPDIRVAMWNADALLLMHYGIVKNNINKEELIKNSPQWVQEAKIWQ